MIFTVAEKYEIMMGFVAAGGLTVFGALVFGKPRKAPRPVQPRPEAERAVEPVAQLTGARSVDPYDDPNLRVFYGPAELARRDARLRHEAGLRARRAEAVDAEVVFDTAAPSRTLASRPFDETLHNGWGKDTRDRSAWDTAEGALSEMIAQAKADRAALMTSTAEWDISKLWETDAPVDAPQPAKTADEIWLAEQIAQQDKRWAAQERVWSDRWVAFDVRMDSLTWGGYRDALVLGGIDAWAAEALHINTSELYALELEPANA